MNRYLEKLISTIVEQVVARISDDKHNVQDSVFIRESSGSYNKVSYNDILYLKADGAYTEIKTSGDQSYLVAANLSKIGKDLDVLNNNLFFRINRSVIINITRIVKIEKGDGSVILDDGSRFYYTKTSKDSLFSKLRILKSV